jgi:hypothetical protein
MDLLIALRRTAERGVAEIDRIVQSYFHERDTLEPLPHEKLARRLQGSEAAVRMAEYSTDQRSLGYNVRLRRDCTPCDVRDSGANASQHDWPTERRSCHQALRSNRVSASMSPV